MNLSVISGASKATGPAGSITPLLPFTLTELMRGLMLVKWVVPTIRLECSPVSC